MTVGDGDGLAEAVGVGEGVGVGVGDFVGEGEGVGDLVGDGDGVGFAGPVPKSTWLKAWHEFEDEFLWIETELVPSPVTV